MEKINMIKKENFFTEWVVPIFAALIIAFLVNKFLVYNVYIPSESMVPTLNKGDKLFVTKIYNLEKIEHGNIIVFYSDELQETLIKRVIGLPGDHIEIKHGIVSVNGQQLTENYVKNNEDYDGIFDVPDGKYFFLGDNRARSNDARKWINPYIDGDDIKGKAQIKIWPLKDFGPLN
ncbi:signal peptidase I [Clostridium taeniosporum]|uniref:Signal peptidase I n=1 Tax=Clostridium taeniosporum TaxID=394958 RepID=A0A1D7XNP9_9CLOT|nr:signal peptidase I [Clostridium taeniosporum]AOR24972.1 signal peptidase I [Clostridium taeniosporum]